MNALEFTTDLLVQSGQYRLDAHLDRFVQITPSELNFWFGNRVIFRTVLDDAKAQHIADGLPEAGLDTYLAGHSATRRALIAQGLG